MRAIVVGAGIGGLTASIALRAADIDAVVFDQAPQVGATMVGGGFHIWPNAVREGIVNSVFRNGPAESVGDHGFPR